MPGFSYRHATASEIRANFRLFAPDRPLYEPSLWKKLPDLFSELLEAKRVRMAAVHDGDGRVGMLVDVPSSTLVCSKKRSIWRIPPS